MNVFDYCRIKANDLQEIAFSNDIPKGEVGDHFSNTYDAIAHAILEYCDEAVSDSKGAYSYAVMLKGALRSIGLIYKNGGFNLKADYRHPKYMVLYSKAQKILLEEILEKVDSCEMPTRSQ